jgi:hypothetical protein
MRPVEVVMLTPSDYDDVIVTVAHPFGDVETTLSNWIRVGPGPRRLVEITAARRANGDVIPLESIPLEFHNSPRSRDLQRRGLLPAPWGPPPEEKPFIH